MKNTNAPIPYIFKNEDELREALEKSVELVNAFLTDKRNSIAEAVEKSVSGNTFRAFHFKKFNVDVKPSTLYKTEVVKIFEERINSGFYKSLEEQNTESNHNKYTEFIIDSAHRISTAFDAAVGKKGYMGFGRAAKLFNLSCKEVIRLKNMSDAQQKILVTLAHVPWDSFTIQGIKELSPPFKIKGNETMRWDTMNSIENYKKLQDWIRNKCGQNNKKIYPIHFEFAAWNLAHPKFMYG
jgi:hypothetical protein